MSKRLLNEEAIRRFQKLANITSGKLNEEYEAAYQEDEEEVDAPEMDAPEVDEVELDEEPMPEEKTFTEEDLVTGIKAMMDSLGVEAEVEAGDVDEAPEMDDMEADEEEDLEVDMGDDKEASDEELMDLWLAVLLVELFVALTKQKEMRLPLQAAATKTTWRAPRLAP